MTRLERWRFTDVRAYLPRTAADPGPWEDVLGKAPEALRSALLTPLMVGLARDVYSDDPAREPAHLLDDTRFPTRQAIEDHLLDASITAAYGDGSDDLPARRRLAELASHLRRSRTYNLAWWELGKPMALGARALLAGSAVAVVGWALAVAVHLAFGFDLSTSVQGGLMSGGLAGAAFAAAHAWLAVKFPQVLRPTSMRLRLRPGKRRETGRRLTVGLLCGAALGAALNLINSILAGSPLDRAFFFFDTAILAIGYGSGAALAFALLSLLETPFDLQRAGAPAELLASNRRTVAIQVLVSTITASIGAPVLMWGVVLLLRWSPLTGWFGLSPNFDPLYGLFVWANTAAIAGAGYALALTAWGQWLLFAWVWLPVTGALPWNLPRFLEDAYARRVLRRFGPYYQFRHSRMQDYLAGGGLDPAGTGPDRA
ncbi:hypothetical protein J7S33_28230 [Saccharothrix algeriensis]|uniref:Uncharacterized protein n=1 Tax=Saccharothrix algeriensis TaxID=173560 RepID=A0A8T8HW90_9PSEU|nr:hypothetical protein J7S33_28230 [Saccharothrix algeriensis]